MTIFSEDAYIKKTGKDKNVKICMNDEKDFF